MHVGRTAATIRQISNPMAATDCTLLALAGTGHPSRRAFGFASCNRAVGASEGMNVLQRRRRAQSAAGSGQARVQYEYGVTNVEYTEFTRLGIEDKAAEGGAESAFPANTNILYVGAFPACGSVQPLLLVFAFQVCYCAPWGGGLSRQRVS